MAYQSLLMTSANRLASLTLVTIVGIEAVRRMWAEAVKAGVQVDAIAALTTLDGQSVQPGPPEMLRGQVQTAIMRLRAAIDAKMSPTGGADAGRDILLMPSSRQLTLPIEGL